MPIIGGSSGGAAPSTVAGFEIGYDQITASVTIASVTEAAGTTVITCAPHVFDGAAALATFSAPFLQTPSTAAGTATICLFEGATEIGRLCGASDPTAAQFWAPAVGQLRFTPTAASHSYTVTVFASSAAGAVGAGPGGTGAYAPAFIRFTKV